jgi:hypothetical protein
VRKDPLPPPDPLDAMWERAMQESAK